MKYIILLCLAPWVCRAEITPYKFNSYEEIQSMNYVIPEPSIYKAPRKDGSPPITYYLSKPKSNTYPIVILCGGSSTKDSIVSIIHTHRYFLKELLERNFAVLTVEQWGVNGNEIDKDTFMQHYTRSQRLTDHISVIKYLKKTPPNGWDGKIIFIGISEGGPIATSLTEKFPDRVLATINWSGAGDLGWRKELWPFIKEIRNSLSWWMTFLDILPKWAPFSLSLPKSQKDLNKSLDETLKNPTYEKEFLGMTYMYHSDALNYPNPDYPKIKTPYLVVAGGQDPDSETSDAFVQKAKESGMNITYFRIEDMDHYIRKRPDIVEKSLKWLDEKLRR